jgi:hypothetical protein
MVIFHSYVKLPEGIVHFHGTSIYKWMTKGTPIVGNLHILDIPQNIGINATQMGSYLETVQFFWGLACHGRWGPREQELMVEICQVHRRADPEVNGSPEAQVDWLRNRSTIEKP